MPFIGFGFLADPTNGDMAVTIIGKRGQVSAFSEPHPAQRLRRREVHTRFRSAPCPILPMALMTKEWL